MLSLRLALALFAVAHSELVVAQQAPARPSGGRERALREWLDVREIELDAVVTDRDDQPVTGLGPADFALAVDGKKVKITGVSSGVELRETVAGRLTVVVLLDNRHLQSRHRELALAEIAGALDRELLDHPTWVAVAAIGERGLQPLLAPTRDRGAMRRAFERATALEPAPTELRRQQRAAVTAVRDMLRSLTQSGSAYRVGSASKGGVTAQVRSYGEALAADTRQTIGSIASLVEALSFVPGRKAVLLLSDGLPRHPLDLLAKTMYDRLAGGTRHYGGDDLTSRGSASFNDPTTRPTGSDRADNSARVRPVVQVDDGGAYSFQTAVAELTCGPPLDRLAALANSHRVTFYPVKPPVVDPAVSSLDGRSRDRGAITVLTDMRSGLDSLAADTGGIAFAADSGVGDFLAQTREDLSAYYSLTFTPPESMRASGIREMELKVRRKRTRTRYRASYLPLLLTERLASRAWGTLLFDWQENLHGLEVESSVAEIEEKGEVAADQIGWRRIDVLLSLPIGQLELVEAAGASSRARSAKSAPSGAGPIVAGAFRAVLQVRRSDGARLEPEHLAFVVQVPQADLAEARSQYFAVRTAIRLPEGRYDMAVGLWEENTARASFVLEALDVGGAPEVALLGGGESRSASAGRRAAAGLSP